MAGAAAAGEGSPTLSESLRVARQEISDRRGEISATLRSHKEAADAALQAPAGPRAAGTPSPSVVREILDAQTTLVHRVTTAETLARLAQDAARLLQEDKASEATLTEFRFNEITRRLDELQVQVAALRDTAPAPQSPGKLEAVAARAAAARCRAVEQALAETTDEHRAALRRMDERMEQSHARGMERMDSLVASLQQAHAESVRGIEETVQSTVQRETAQTQRTLLEQLTENNGLIKRLETRLDSVAADTAQWEQKLGSLRGSVPDWVAQAEQSTRTLTEKLLVAMSARLQQAFRDELAGYARSEHLDELKSKTKQKLVTLGGAADAVRRELTERMDKVEDSVYTTLRGEIDQRMCDVDARHSILDQELQKQRAAALGMQREANTAIAQLGDKLGHRIDAEAERSRAFGQRLEASLAERMADMEASVHQGSSLNLDARLARLRRDTAADVEAHLETLRQDAARMSGQIASLGRRLDGKEADKERHAWREQSTSTPLAQQPAQPRTPPRSAPPSARTGAALDRGAPLTGGSVLQKRLVLSDLVL